LDTNVLVAGFVKEEAYHAQARLFLDEVEDDLLVPVVVLVEAWGLIVGREKRPDLGLQMIRWVNTPGRATVLPQPIDDFIDVQTLLESTRVDCVDGILFNLALRLTGELRTMPLVRVATYDASDFYRCMSRRGVNIEILNMREGL
jgi:predicted nucleic acid-binding protein